MATLARLWKPASRVIIRSTCSNLRVSQFWRCNSMHSSCQIIYERFGDPKQVLERRDVQVHSEPDKGQVLVEMLMAPVNPSDINMIEGTYFIRPPLPAIVGNEGVGKVIAVGSDVSALCIGDWVIPAEAGLGTWRQFAVTDATDVFKIPNDIPVASAATLLVNPPTAYRMLKDYVDLKPGDIVIQNGANSSVGQCVIQLAKQWGVTTVNMVRDRPDIDKLTNYLKDLGADHVISEEFSRTPQMKDFMKSLPNKPKLGLNCVGGKSSTEIIRYLGQAAKMITYGGMSRKPITVPTGALLFKEIKLEGYWNTEWNKRNRDSLVRKQMYDDLCTMIRDGKFKNPICDLYAIDDYKKAVADSLEGFTGTKKILVMDKSLV